MENNNPWKNSRAKLDEFQDPPLPCSSQCREYVRRENRLHSQVERLLKMFTVKLNMQRSEILSLKKKKTCIKCNQDKSAIIFDSTCREISVKTDLSDRSHERLDENENPSPTCSSQCQLYARGNKRMQNMINQLIEIGW